MKENYSMKFNQSFIPIPKLESWASNYSSLITTSAITIAKLEMNNQIKTQVANLDHTPCHFMVIILDIRDD